MAVEIDIDNASCRFSVEGIEYHKPLSEVRIATDSQARMSVLESGAARLLISEDEAQRLVAAGAADERRNLIEDE
ncbi:DUF3203 family protein [Pseudomonas indica]|jgi:hypothetical protein|uniref:DUF3203 family protein n=1 Tax=Pseudomonas indica TaxID=137658 RepID=UPI000BD1FBCD|nr:DUF3203 family protein [Pseudomonas indica]PAU59107.1 hypothetical protein BZL42_11570 [Pseudomonas indica]